MLELVYNLLHYLLFGILGFLLLFLVFCLLDWHARRKHDAWYEKASKSDTVFIDWPDSQA